MFPRALGLASLVAAPLGGCFFVEVPGGATDRFASAHGYAADPSGDEPVAARRYASSTSPSAHAAIAVVGPAPRPPPVVVGVDAGAPVRVGGPALAVADAGAS